MPIFQNLDCIRIYGMPIVIMHSIWFWTYQHENYLRPTTFYRTSEVMYYKTMMLQKIFLSEFDQIVCWFWMLDKKKSKAGRQKYILIYSNWDILPFISYTAVPTNAAGWSSSRRNEEKTSSVLMRLFLLLNDIKSIF